jgi:amino acid transporter
LVDESLSVKALLLAADNLTATTDLEHSVSLSDSQPAPATAPPSPKLGTFAGVFTPSVLTILGLVLFLREGYVVGSAGLARALLIILVANAISILTSFSLAAIATNFRVKGGGDYYLISRTLGLGFGAAIGIVLFLAQSVSIGFYCIGMGEALISLVPGGEHWEAQGVAAVAVLVLAAFAWKGVDWATRFQYAIMATLALALLSFGLGAWEHFSPELLSANIPEPEPAPRFWMLFAVFFPAVTGFTQGVSMSGDLRDPGKSIPLGTFLAVGVSFCIYLAVAVLLAGASSNAQLAGDYGVMKSVSAAGWLIDLGVLAATLSSALASLMGAPRILQALARDRVVPFVQPFGRGIGATRNPRRGVVLSAAIGLAIVVMGDLNLVASVVSMFFLASYALVNYATYFEAGTASPSFRPRFRWYDRRLSLAGMILCAGAMLAIDPWAALAAIAVLAAIYRYLNRGEVRARWADSRRSHDLQQVREHLLSAEKEEAHPKDWRPYILAFSDDPERRAQLLKFASWIEGGSGITTVVRVLQGEGAGMLREREEALASLQKELKQLGSDAFPLVVSAPTLEDAVPMLVQACGTGPIAANTVLVNWIERESALVDQWTHTRYGRNLRTAFRLGSNLVILDANKAEWEALAAAPAKERLIDIWWGARETSELMLLLAYLMTRSDDWDGARIRVLVPAEGRDAHKTLESMRELLEAARIDAETEVVEGAPGEALLERSRGASIVFLPLEMRAGHQVDPYGHEAKDIVKLLPIVVLTMAAQNVDLDAQPDEGKLAEEAALRDRYEDARKLAAKAAKAAADADDAVEKALKAFSEAASSSAAPEALEKPRSELRSAQVEARQAARVAERSLVARDRAERAAKEAGVTLEEERKGEK